MAFGLVLSLAALPAWGLDINLLDNVWQPADSLPSYTVNNVLPGLNLTVAASGGAGTLWWDQHNGFGVRGGWNQDEIDYGEILTITFSQPVFLNSFYLYDLYKERGNRRNWYRERGYARLDGGPKQRFKADPDQIYPGFGDPIGGGLKVVAIGTGGVSEIQFFANKSKNLPKVNHDYQVWKLDVDLPGSAVPEPGTLVLVGSALLGGLGLSRRRWPKRPNR